jgi:hypothetical protein
MAPSGLGADRSPVVIIPPGSGSAPRPGAPGGGNKVVAGLVALGLRVMCCQAARFQEGVAMTATALEALGGIGQENQASMMALLPASNKRQVRRLEPQVRTVKGAGQMARSGPLTLAAGGEAAADEGRRA